MNLLRLLQPSALATVTSPGIHGLLSTWAPLRLCFALQGAARSSQLCSSLPTLQKPSPAPRLPPAAFSISTTSLFYFVLLAFFLCVFFFLSCWLDYGEKQPVLFCSTVFLWWYILHDNDQENARLLGNGRFHAWLLGYYCKYKGTGQFLSKCIRCMLYNLVIYS